MSVPLDRLYNYLNSLLSSDTIIYRFSPHGSKNLSDLLPLSNDVKNFNKYIPKVICFDQEPLDFEYYNDPANLQGFIDRVLPEMQNSADSSVPCWYYTNVPGAIQELSTRNLAAATFNMFHARDSVLLVHSEQQSPEVDKYERNGYIGVYWWSHALIAHDWYRFAQHDPALFKTRNPQRDFLIYNRAWSGTREYRLKFADLLVEHSLVGNCNTRFNPSDTGIHYTNHNFKNTRFAAVRNDLDTFFEYNNADPTSSADYVAADYRSTGIEVVLETLFDDPRIQLTEKILRPIACGQPFMLASTPGSLQYLRNYGFKTFNGLIDESYDNIVDPAARLDAIVAEMKRISSLPAGQKLLLFTALDEIANYNHRHFFSAEFFDRCVGEFISNATSAIGKLLAQPVGHNRQVAYSRIKEFCAEQFNEFLEQHPAIKANVELYNAEFDQFNKLHR